MIYEGKLTGVKTNEVTIRLKETFDLDEAKRHTDVGESIQLKVTVVDKRSITTKQQRFIYALFGDISDYTGYPTEWVKDVLQRTVRT